ncbi:MAG: hypothetical protein Q4C06_06200 [Bacillota bacterium]|nr:hypothetical protein [Bacillota bacterium]
MKREFLPISLLSVFLIYALLRYPAPMLAASTDSVQLFLTRVFPSLFPFLAACGILLRLGTAERMGFFFRPFTRLLFGLDGIAAFPFFLGTLSGYPAGAKLTAALYEKKLISSAEASHILVFSNNPGPLFLVGTIGTGFFGSPLLGYGLLLSSFLGSVAAGFLWRFRRKECSPRRLYSPAAPVKCSISTLLSASISDALQTLLLIGGYLMLFSALSAAIAQIRLFPFLSDVLFFLPLSETALQGFFCGLLEMTNGSYLLSQAQDALRLPLTAFLLSFGGLSILGQTFGVLTNVPISKKDYLKGKLCHALFSSLFLSLLLPFLEQNAQKAVPVFSLFTETAFSLSFLWLLPSLFFLGTLCCAFRK